MFDQLRYFKQTILKDKYIPDSLKTVKHPLVYFLKEASKQMPTLASVLANS